MKHKFDTTKASSNKWVRSPRVMGTEEESDRRLQDKIDRTLEDSFPASDPPGWTLGVERSWK